MMEMREEGEGVREMREEAGGEGDDGGSRG